MKITRKLELTEEEYTAIKEAVYHYSYCEELNFRNDQVNKNVDICSKLHSDLP